MRTGRPADERATAIDIHATAAVRGLVLLAADLADTPGEPERLWAAINAIGPQAAAAVDRAKRRHRAA